MELCFKDKDSGENSRSNIRIEGFPSGLLKFSPIGKKESDSNRHSRLRSFLYECKNFIQVLTKFPILVSGLLWTFLTSNFLESNQANFL